MKIDELMQESGVGFGTSGARGTVEAMTNPVCYAYTQGFLQAMQTQSLLQPGAPADYTNCVDGGTKTYYFPTLEADGRYHKAPRYDLMPAGTTMIELARTVLNSLSAHIAILDENGVILETNKAWQTYAVQSGIPETSDHRGINYLEICEAASLPVVASQISR